MEEKWLSIKQVAEMIGKGEQTVTDYCNEGKFPSANRPGGGKWAILESDVKAFMSGKPASAIPVPQGESEEVKKAKDAAIIANENQKKVEHETNIKLLEMGWKTVDDGLKEIIELKKKLEEDRQALEKDKEGYGKKVLECQKHIEESNLHRQVSQQMKAMAEDRYSKAVIKEKESEERIKLAETEIKKLQECVAYFNDNIEPVQKNLKVIRKAVYTEAEEWQKNQSLWNLYQFVTRKMAILEDLLDNVRNAVIPKELMPVTTEVESEVVEPEEKSQFVLSEGDGTEQIKKGSE